MFILMICAFCFGGLAQRQREREKYYFYKTINCCWRFSGCRKMCGAVASFGGNFICLLFFCCVWYTGGIQTGHHHLGISFRRRPMAGLNQHPTANSLAFKKILRRLYIFTMPMQLLACWPASHPVCPHHVLGTCPLILRSYFMPFTLMTIHLNEDQWTFN